MGSGVSQALPSSVYWKIDMLRQSPVFSSISEEHIQDVANCFHVVQFNKGYITLAPDKMYYVAEGEIQILFDSTPKPENKKRFDTIHSKHKVPIKAVDLGTKTVGDFIHPFQSSRVGNSTKQENIKFLCTKPIKCFRLVKKSLQNLSKLIAHQNACKVLVNTLNFLYNDIYHILQHIPFLETATSLQMKIIADMCHCVTFEPNEKIYSRNDVSDHFYIILRGVCSIRSAEQYEIVTPIRKALMTQLVKKSSSEDEGSQEGSPDDSDNSSFHHKNRMVTSVAEGPEEFVMTLIKAGVFGFADMVFGIRRICSVYSETDVVAMRIGKNSLNVYCELFPETEELVKVTAYEKLLFRLKRLGIPVMSGFPEEYFPQIANFCEVMQWNQGDMIIKSGDSSNACVFIILCGEVDVSTTTAKKEIANGASILPTWENHRLRRGSSIGNDVLFTPRSSKSMVVTAKTDTALLKIDKESEQLFAHDQQAFAQYEICIKKNRCKIRSVLNNEKGLYYFEVYLKKFKMDQCIHFIQEVKSLKKLFVENPKTSHSVMTELIVSTYINEKAAHKVPLKRETRVAVEVAQQHGIIFDESTHPTFEPRADIFDTAVSEITRKLKMEYFSGFKSSQYFEELLNSFTSEKWKNVSFERKK